MVLNRQGMHASYYCLKTLLKPEVLLPDQKEEQATDKYCRSRRNGGIYCKPEILGYVNMHPRGPV